MTDDDEPAPATNKRSPDQPEHRLSHWCRELLARILLEPCWATAQDTAGRAIGATWAEQQQSRMRWEQNQKWYGVKPDQLDWRIFQAPIYAEIELKFGDNKPTTGQQTTMRLLRERDIPTGCAWTLREFYGLLVEARFQLHANAANILTEIEARHAAAQDAAVLKKKAPKSYVAQKPRAPKPSAAAVRRMNAVRGRVPF